MIAFFDTSVHIDLLRGELLVGEVLSHVRGGPVRLSPIVAGELLRGASRTRAMRSVKRLVSSLVSIEPPSWRHAWLEAGQLLPRIFRSHEAVGLARLQNDVLLALTARHTGAVLVSRDAHFEELQRRLRFRVLVLRSS
jgi:predicted nucleic acid-binding protein